jgi:N4-gp56 family major capsid protein
MIDKVAAEASDALGEQAGDSLDQLTRTALVASGSAQYANDATSTVTVDSTDLFSASEALEALATLKANKAVPINGTFPALIHPYTEYDLYQDPITQAVLSYSKERGDTNPWMTGYIGDAFGLSFYCTPNGYVNTAAGASSINVYNTLILGKQAFGIGGLAAYMPAAVKGMKQGNNTFQKVRPLRLIQHDFGSSGSIDPFNQRASIAWYTTFVAKPLDANFYVRVEHATTLG